MPPTQFGLRPLDLCEHPVFKPSQITLSATEDCRLWLETPGANISAVSERRPTLHKEQSLDQGQVPITWLLTLCCATTWLFMDTLNRFGQKPSWCCGDSPSQQNVSEKNLVEWTLVPLHRKCRCRNTHSQVKYVKMCLHEVLTMVGTTAEPSDGRQLLVAKHGSLKC